MLYRITATLIAVGLVPSASQCQSFTLEMTTATTVSDRLSILPSSSPLLFFEGGPQSIVPPHPPNPIFLPNVLQTTFTGEVEDALGYVDLNFNLIVGSETLSQIGTHRFYLGPRVAMLELEDPVVFNSRIGRFTIGNSNAVSIVRDLRHGSVFSSPLRVRMGFHAVPEPSNCVLLTSLAAICSGRYRVRSYRWKGLELLTK
jgi:hypothetical protein